MKAEHRVAGGQQNLRLGLEGLRFQAVLQGLAVVLLRDLDIAVARGVQRFRVPTESLGFVDRALDVVAERSRPVYGEARAEFVTDIDGVPHAELGVFANLGRFGGRTGGPHGVMKRLGGDHRALDAVFTESLLDVGDDLGLAIRAHGLGWNHVGVVRGPVSDADLGIFAG